jgi:hypothetical protein
LRKTIFYTPALDQQISFENALAAFNNLPEFEFFRQLALTLNILFIYAGVVLWKLIKKAHIHRYYCFQVILLFVMNLLLVLTGGHGNNAGRYFYLVVPFVIVALVREILPLIDRPVPGEKLSI